MDQSTKELIDRVKNNTMVSAVDRVNITRALTRLLVPVRIEDIAMSLVNDAYYLVHARVADDADNGPACWHVAWWDAIEGEFWNDHGDLLAGVIHIINQPLPESV